jgi:23S rRNA pseudouridine1911/1915/1917 synthase
MTQPTLNLTTIPIDLIDSRLDKVLFSAFPGYSRAYFQELIDKGFVLVNGKKITKCSYLVKATDQISVTIPPAKEYDLAPMQVDFDVVDENADFLVINKPAGLVVHPSDNNKEEVSLVHGLLHRYPDFCNLKDEQRPGVVHRLDRETSGLMLVARTERSQRELISMFEKRQMHKTYLAVVAHHPHKSGTIEFPIGRHPIHRHKMSHKGISSREATSHYENFVYYKDSSLVAVRIITGRTHQIRVHMAAIGHGIVGDTLYGYKSRLIARQALHSWKLSFEYRGKQFNYQIPVPQDMKILLKKLKNGEKFN